MPHDRGRQCVINNRAFFVFGSLVAFYVPMLIMVVTYTLTVQLLRRKARFAAELGPEVSAAAGPGPFPVRRFGPPRYRHHQSGPGGSILRPSISQPQLNYSVAASCVSGGVANVSGKGGATSNRDNGDRRWGCDQDTQRQLRLGVLRFPILPAISTASLNLRFLGPSGVVGARWGGSTGSRAGSGSGSGDGGGGGGGGGGDGNGHAAAVHAVLTEQKASKVLGLVFFTFVLCWAPFFVLNIVFAAFPNCQVPEHVVNTCLWLGYVSSTINPVIYTVFNRTFRAAFTRLLCCRCHRASGSCRCGALSTLVFTLFARYRSVTKGRILGSHSCTSSAAGVASVAALPLSLSLSAVGATTVTSTHATSASAPLLLAGTPSTPVSATDVSTLYVKRSPLEPTSEDDRC